MKSADYNVQVAIYEQNVRDYHQLVVEQLEKMVTLIKGKNNQFNYKISVDSGRISEKNWAVKAGLGYYGKNGVFLWSTKPQNMFS